MWRFIGLPIYLFIGISCYPTNYKQPIWYGTQTVKGIEKDRRTNIKLNNNPTFELKQSPNNPPLYKRSFKSFMTKTSKGAKNVARSVINALLPVTKTYGPTSMLDRMVKKQTIPRVLNKRQMNYPGPYFNYNYQPNAYFRTPTYGYYYNYNPYIFRGDNTKRSFLPYYPYNINNYNEQTKPANVSDKRSLPYTQYLYPYQYQYRNYVPYQYSEETRKASNIPLQYSHNTRDIPVNSQAKSKINSQKTGEIKPQNKTDIISVQSLSAGLLDLQNDMDGFKDAVQNMKDAFIQKNNKGLSELSETLYNNEDVVGEKRDIIQAKKTPNNLVDAFKRTLNSKNRLENKLVNYFTEYVCEKDC